MRKVFAVAVAGVVMTLVAACGGTETLSPSLELTPQEESLVSDWRSKTQEERAEFCAHYLTVGEDKVREIVEDKAPSHDPDVFMRFYDKMCLFDG